MASLWPPRVAAWNAGRAYRTHIHTVNDRHALIFVSLCRTERLSVSVLTCSSSLKRPFVDRVFNSSRLHLCVCPDVNSQTASLSFKSNQKVTCNPPHRGYIDGCRSFSWWSRSRSRCRWWCSCSFLVRSCSSCSELHMIVLMIWGESFSVYEHDVLMLSLVGEGHRKVPSQHASDVELYSDSQVVMYVQLQLQLQLQYRITKPKHKANRNVFSIYSVWLKKLWLHFWFQTCTSAD